MDQSRPLFHNFRLFNTVDSKQMFYIKVAGFEPRTFGVGSDRSTNSATAARPYSLILEVYTLITLASGANSQKCALLIMDLKS